jgi:hypothetical protein
VIGVVAQADPAFEAVADALVRILGFAVLAAGASAAAAIAFRWYSADELAEGIGILVGITAVAVWLNTKTALQDAIIGTTPLLETETAVYTVVVFAMSAIAADGGRRLGDHLARDVFSLAAPRTIDDVGQLVRSAGRVIAVEIPEAIEDVDGYDPVDASTKAGLAGQTFLFPRRLSTEQLRERLSTRLERDYGIGHVDIELTAEGEIEYLGIGSRPAGIGPTLAPGTVAVAICADPAADASPGDAVRIWAPDDGSFRGLASAELRGTADDVTTVAVDATEADALETGVEYRLVTHPETPEADRELVSALRAADETVAAIGVDAGGSLEGRMLESVPALVLAIDGDDEVRALPPGDDRFVAGDTAYVLGRPEVLRRLSER